MKEVTPERQAQARELAAAIAESSEQELLQIALTLLEAEDPASLFGDTEFKVRDLALKIAAKAYEQRLAAQKKTATKPPV
jgi:hypothetical protein